MLANGSSQLGFRRSPGDNLRGCPVLANLIEQGVVCAKANGVSLLGVLCTATILEHFSFQSNTDLLQNVQTSQTNSSAFQLPNVIRCPSHDIPREQS